MDNGIHIEGNPSKESVTEVGVQIVRILEAGHDYHADRETLITALKTLGRLGSVEGTSINNCNVSSREYNEDGEVN